MKDDLRRRLYPKNPLGIIALFVFFIEAIATVSFKFMLENESSYTEHLVWFIILFPTLIVLLFFVTLWWKRESFYSPMDFRSDETFLELLQKVDTLDTKQEASQLDPAADLDVSMKIIQRLVERNDIYTAIQVGRSSLKDSRYENTSKIFTYLEMSVPSSHELHTRIRSNLAYSLIGLGKFTEAINKLLEVCNLRGEKGFYVSQAVALAYAYFKIGKIDEYREWLDYSKQRSEYASNLPLMIKLYPDIAEDLTTP